MVIHKTIQLLGLKDNRNMSCCYSKRAWLCLAFCEIFKKIKLIPPKKKITKQTEKNLIGLFMYAKAFVPNKYLQKQSPGEKIALTQLEM